MPAAPDDVVSDLPLAADFAPATADDWRKLVDSVLKGAPFETLIAKTYDGLAIEPIHARAKGAHAIASRAAAAPWQVMQRIDHPDAAQANAQALHDLDNGATGLTLVFADAIGARGFGLPPTAEAVAKALDGVLLDAGISIELEMGPQSRAIALRIADDIRTKGADPAACDIRFGLDPLGACAASGSSVSPWSDIAPAVAETAKKLAAVGFHGPFLAADGRVIHDAGGSEAQELAFVLASLVAYLRALESAGIDLDDARGMIHARLAADADQFLTLAKFRALRLSWARIEQACGLAPKPLFIAAETAWRMLTRYDPYVNMLRATISAFSAGLGGADSVCVLPHTLVLGLPDAFARRIARNTQLILIEESNLAKVADPAAGSGGIEALTRQLCEAAWRQFQDIEKAGGAFAALTQNLIQRDVVATRAAREANVAKRRDVLTGASEFPNLHEKPAAVLDAIPHAPEPCGDATITFDALAPMRLAAAFEQLRDRSNDWLKATGARPTIFLATLGTAADFTARATFARSFFETGGIEAVDFAPALPPNAPPHPDPLPNGEREKSAAATQTAIAAAFKASGAQLVCLCSSDQVYADQGAAAARTLHAAGARHIYLAGRPGKLEAALRSAGVQDFIFAGVDALAMLNDAWQRLEQR
ncbi:MAG: heterodimeric methylmalonyl-CoA mutase small subunit [Nitrobacter sp.]|uniref:methylmalonyl-CoA mutase family protein n=1 Tax=Nitrobacter sp. TaxID=29420 RepID=UPI00387DEF60